MKRSLMIAAFALFFGSLAAHAEDQSSGCGLGWQVSNKNSLLSSSIRNTTNGIASNQTFGMTSGTSGCAKHSIVQNDKKGIHYAEANFQNLQVEMAEGHGEFVENFASVLGCSPASYGEFSNTMRAHYSEIFDESATPSKVLTRVKGAMQAEPGLVAGCKVSA
jgi:hypothetical protein